jgi:hypothetical protein
MHGNVGKNLDDSLPFQAMTYFFCKTIPWGVFQENKHLLILDGMGQHHYSCT